jgi:excisionase family DNA binding protein
MNMQRPQPLTQNTAVDTDATPSDEYALGPEEVARILDRSAQEVRGLARRGKLRARRMGTRWTFRRNDVLAYLGRLSQIDKSI